MKNFKQEEKQRIEEHLTKLNERKSLLETNPDKVINNWIKSIDKRLPDLYQGKPKNPDNITMKQHLMNVKKRLQEKSQEVIKEQLDRVNSSIARGEQRLTEINKEISE